MKTADRKSAIDDYKQRKTAAGIYAVRCQATGEVWVGQAPSVDTVQNRVWFTLRMGSHMHAGLQALWQVHGAEAFSFEVLERLDVDEPAYARATLLKERLAHWRARLSAPVI